MWLYGRMVIQPLRSAPVPYWTPVSRPLAASGPTDEVEVSQEPPPTPRQLLWTSLETAQVMSGDAIRGPLGNVLTLAQKDGLKEVLRGIQQQGGQLDPERTLKQILKSAPEFETPLTIGFQSQTWEIKNLTCLQDAARLAGTEPVEPAGPALLRLAQQGWSIQDRHSYSDDAKPLTVLEAYRTVTRGHPLSPDDVKLKPPPGHPRAEHDMRADSDTLPAVDFFYGSGSTDGLENPELARGMKSLQGEGIVLTCWGSSYGLGERDEEPFSWYSSAVKGNELKLVEHKQEVAEFNSIDPAGIEVIRAEHRKWVQVDQNVFQPAVRAGILDERNLDDMVKETAREVPGLTLEERAALCVDLIQSDKKKDFYDARRLYDDLVDLELQGPEFKQECRRASQLAQAVGADSARQAIEYLHKDLKEQIPFEPARQRSEKAFMALVLGGAETKLAQECLTLARTQVDGSPFEARLEELGKLHRSGLRQEGYEGLAEDYRAVLENRRSGENLTQAVRPLLRLMDALAAMGKAELARETYVYIRQSLEFGTLTGTEQELVDRFLQTLLLRNSPEDALKSLHRPDTPTAPGSVQETRENVKVGGVIVRRKKKRPGLRLLRRRQAAQGPFPRSGTVPFNVEGRPHGKADRFCPDALG